MTDMLERVARAQANVMVFFDQVSWWVALCDQQGSLRQFPTHEAAEAYAGPLRARAAIRAVFEGRELYDDDKYGYEWYQIDKSEVDQAIGERDGA